MAADSRTRLRRTFEAAASSYDEARPAYPDELFDDLIALAGLTRGDRLLEIGCGTGKATRPLLHRGFPVVCVEAGEKLASLARENLTGLAVEICVSEFETWEAPRDRFDLVYAATAWHWLDPTVCYGKAHRLLRPGGHLSLWSAGHAFPADADPIFAELQDVYDAIGERRETWPPPPPEEVPDQSNEIEATGLFEHVQTRRYVWAISYTADQYIALLGTFSSHIAMDPRDREYLFREIRRRVASRPEGRIRRHWYAILHVAQRR